MPFNRRFSYTSLLWRFCITVSLLFFLFLVWNFHIYMKEVRGYSTVSSFDVEGLVVLTGGRGRLFSAMELLAENPSNKRLLMTGISKKTSLNNLRLLVGNSTLLACCVDVGYAGQDTKGNARETAAWVQTHGYKSIMVITSGYHLPRSLRLLHKAMPEVTLVPYAVWDASMAKDSWWNSFYGWKIMLTEYGKYITQWLFLDSLPAAVTFPLKESSSAPVKNAIV